MWIGNAMLLVLNLPLIGLWVQAAQHSLIGFCFRPSLLFCAIGVYSLATRSPFEIALAALRRLRLPAAQAAVASRRPFLLGFVIGPMLEEICAAPC